MPPWRQVSPTTSVLATPSPRFHPHSLLSHHGSVHAEVPRKVRCCHLYIDLGSRQSSWLPQSPERGFVIGYLR